MAGGLIIHLNISNNAVLWLEVLSLTQIYHLIILMKKPFYGRGFITHSKISFDSISDKLVNIQMMPFYHLLEYIK